MKKLFLTILFAIIVFGCKKTEDPPDYKIVNGLYGGCFYYKDINHGYSITLDSNIYQEGLSGGLYYQKWCITGGTYSVEGDKLIFVLDSSKGYYDTLVYPCNQENWLLPGEYTIDYLHNDSLVFERGEGDSWIIYYLKRDIN
ncbi:MAG: hypothetical protein K8R52_01785 [Bacteroidales bacterium]|nr:hypothetical protein [Bacteroidales bacterium]